jgi:predicted transcriptional regulator
MHSFGESPKEENASRLSQILEVSAHPRFYLSAKACEGILRRAERREKTLPPMLKEALEQMIEREKT